MQESTAQSVMRRRPNGRAEANSFTQLVTAVQHAEDLRLAGKLDRARSACAAVLKQDADYVAALFTMGLILADQSQFETAVGYMHRAAMLNPNDSRILTGLSGVYLRLEANLMAARTLKQALKVAPNDANILITLGEIYRDEKEYELSVEAYEAALAVDPTRVAAQLGLAQNLMDIGQLAEAAELLKKRIREEPGALSCLYSLSQLPASLVDFDLISLLDEAKPPPNKSLDEFHCLLGFAKAAALDKAGRHEEAWEQVLNARRYDAAENRRDYRQRRDRHAPLLELARTTKLDEQIDRRVSSEHPVSLFIAGPSRSGKTSLERLVGSVTGVKRGYENPIVENAVRRVFRTAGYPTRSLLVQLPPGFSDMFQQFYREELVKRAGSAKVLTNTLPVRVEDALRAASEIPNARFVFVKRDIDDLTVRIFMKNYKRGNFYASNLHDIRDYLKWCHQMIDVAAQRMPKISLVINYEDMVTDPVGSLGKVGELCDLDICDVPLPPIGDERGCAAPYRDLIQAELRQGS